MQTANQEQQRQQYLAAMGVTSWLPVQALAGAAASPCWEWQDIDQTRLTSGSVSARHSATPDGIGADPVVTARPPVVETTGRGAGQAAAIQQMLSTGAGTGKQVPPDTDIARPVAAEPSSSENAVDGAPEQQIGVGRQASQAVPRFRLAVIGYADCLVVSDLPMDVIQGFTGSHQTLLGRILASIGLGSGDPLVQLFAWPVISSNHVDQSEEVARAGVAGVLRRVSPDKQLPLLLLGSQATEFSLPADTDPAGLPGLLDGRAVLTACSLNELMRVPGQKRELWHQLLALKSLLSAL